MTREVLWERLANRTRNLVVDWGKLHSARPPILFHYTSASGLLGILRSQRLWATNSRFMNDPTEIAYALRLLREVAPAEIDTFQSKALEPLKKRLSRIFDDYEKDARVYVTCFCRQGDLLSQWRGYGAVGGGYAVGLAALNLGEFEIRPKDFGRPKPILRRVIYQRTDQERFVKAWIRLLSEAKLKRQFFPSVWFNFMTFLAEMMNCYKDPAYEQEDEWRLIQFGRVNGREIVKADFRENAGRIVPYVALDVTARKGQHKKRLPIEVVRFGPTLEPRTTRRAMELLCGAHGYSIPPLIIEKSVIPFTG
jgi:hypothetical protein